MDIDLDMTLRAPFKGTYRGHIGQILGCLGIIVGHRSQ